MTREQYRALPGNSNGDWTSLGPHERLPEIPIITPEKSHAVHRSSKIKHEILLKSQDVAFLFLQGPECNPESSVKTPQEA